MCIVWVCKWLSWTSTGEVHEMICEAVFTGLRLHLGAFDSAVGAGGSGGPVPRGPASAGVCVQAATAHQAPGRQDTHAQGEGQEEGGALHLDL